VHIHETHRDPLDTQFAALLEKALEAYRSKQQAFAAAIKSFERWHIDAEMCHLQFSNSKGQTKTFAITPIATYLPEPEDWVWAWANDAFPVLSGIKSARVKALSLKTGYKIFEAACIRASLSDIDELCALALHELNGLAIFKIKDQSPWCFHVVE